MKQRPPKRMKPNVFYVALDMQEAMSFLAWKSQRAMDRAMTDALVFGRGIKLSKIGGKKAS